MTMNSEDKAYRRLLETEKACLRARNLAGQLLTFSKGGAPVKKVTSIADLIKDWVSFAVSGSNVRCEFSINNNLWSVEADEGQISQAINNIVINADQAMPDGGVIKIKAQNIIREESSLAPYSETNISPIKEGRYVEITIEDEGVGIQKEHLVKIFDPYFTTKQKANGLGLAAAYSIVKNHSGYIGAESKLGIGTRFYIYLPVSEKEIAEDSEIEATSIGKGRVLVMDDEEIIREVLREMISQMGYEVKFAMDGAEAIELYTRAIASNKPFDLVIMDLTIPDGMGGKETVKNLINVDPEVRAVVSSGYSNDPVMSNYREYGFIGVISKPYNIEELTETLNKLIKRGENQ
jgi:CheY-like chemotaxis protein